MKYEEIQVHNTCSLPLCNQSLQVQELQGLKEAYQLPAHNTSYKKKNVVGSAKCMRDYRREEIVKS